MILKIKMFLWLKILSNMNNCDTPGFVEVKRGGRVPAVALIGVKKKYKNLTLFERGNANVFIA